MLVVWHVCYIFSCLIAVLLAVNMYVLLEDRRALSLVS